VFSGFTYMWSESAIHTYINSVSSVQVDSMVLYPQHQISAKKNLHSFPVIASSNFHCLLQNVFFLLLSSSSLQNKNIVLSPFCICFS